MLIDDARRLHGEYAEKGVKIRMEPTNFPWALKFQQEDPDGNVLLLGSEPELRTQTEKSGSWGEADCPIALPTLTHRIDRKSDGVTKSSRRSYNKHIGEPLRGIDCNRKSSRNGRRAGLQICNCDAWNGPNYPA